MNHLLMVEMGCGLVNDLRFDEKVDIVSHPHVTYHQDMTHLPRFGDNRFCLVKSAASLEHLTPDDQVKAVCEWRRILVNGGVVVVQMPDKGYWQVRLDSPNGHEREWASIQMRGGERDEYDVHKGLLDAKGLQDLFESNGYRMLYLRDGNQAAGSLDAAFEKV